MFPGSTTSFNVQKIDAQLQEENIMYFAIYFIFNCLKEIDS